MARATKKTLALAAIAEIEPTLHEADKLSVEAQIWRSYGFGAEATDAESRSTDARENLRISRRTDEERQAQLVDEISDAVIRKIAIALAHEVGLYPGGPS